MYLKHGLTNTPEYRCWQQLKARCLNPKHTAYPDYGGRGIGVHDEWVGDFLAFLAYVGPRPSKHHSLDRKDVNGNYEPGNVRWATWVEQARNRRPHGTAVGLRPPVDPSRTTNFKHGMINTPEYNGWSLMKDRCLNPRSSNYPYWGARGIKIHQPWVDDFMAFYREVGPRPSKRHSLDRIDNEGNYEPGNVRWATRLQQTQNRRPCKTGEGHGNFKHGGTKTPEHKTWGSVKTRCFNPNHDRYPHYGGRGITVCRRWKDSYEAFLEDMGPKAKGQVLLREDLDGSYSCGKCPECQEKGWPANCRWASRTEVNQHRRSNKLTHEKVAALRQMLAEGATHKAVSQEFGIAISLVGKIGRHENWV